MIRCWRWLKLFSIKAETRPIPLHLIVALFRAMRTLTIALILQAAHGRRSRVRDIESSSTISAESDSSAMGEGRVIEEETGKLSTNEDALYGTCCGTCGKNGLVKTDFDGWDEVSNCVFASNGPNDFFCRCDNCNCDGVRRRERSSYTLKNINYDFSAVTNSSIDGDPKDADVVMANSDVENCGDIEQESTTVISFTRSTTTSVETSSTLTTGLTLTVSATQNIGVPADGFTASFSEGFTTSLTKGFTTTKGDSETATFGGEQQVKVKVPGGMRQDFHVVGHQGNINLPYTATLVTHYTKGADKETQTSGSVTIRGVASWATKYDSLTRARCSHEAPENDDVK